MLNRWGALFNAVMQVGLVGFTMLGVFLTAIKLPQYGLIATLVSEIFWVYSAYRAWKEAGQIGILIVTFCITIIAAFGVVNYWAM